MNAEAIGLIAEGVDQLGQRSLQCQYPRPPPRPSELANVDGRPVFQRGSELCQLRRHVECRSGDVSHRHGFEVFTIILFEAIPIDGQLMNLTVPALRPRLNDHLLPEPIR
ncbi:hypothetical protein D3C86_1834670 [compost metagenome]